MDTRQHSPLHHMKTCEETWQAESPHTYTSLCPQWWGLDSWTSFHPWPSAKLIWLSPNTSSPEWGDSGFVEGDRPALRTPPKNDHTHNAILMRRLIILTLHKSFIVCHSQSPQATCTTYFYEPTFQHSEPTIHIIFNYVRAAQDHCLYNITGWRKWDSALLPRES